MPVVDRPNIQIELATLHPAFVYVQEESLIRAMVCLANNQQAVVVRGWERDDGLQL